MGSLTYKDIIDDKIAEWQSTIAKLEEDVATATSETRERFSARMKELKPAIDGAVAQLRLLDAQETVDNTMETKDKILEIFSSIDSDFKGFEGKTPFML